MEAFVTGPSAVLVPPQNYNVTLHSFRTVRMFKAPKLELVFRIVSYGDAFGKTVSRYYNVDAIIGKPQDRGRFKVSRNRDFTREYYTLFDYGGKRLDRLPMSLFEGVIIEAQVVTVKESRGAVIPKPLRYSKIAKLNRVVEC